jgi:hypothetical protein
MSFVGASCISPLTVFAQLKAPHLEADRFGGFVLHQERRAGLSVTQHEPRRGDVELRLPRPLLRMRGRAHDKELRKDGSGEGTPDSANHVMTRPQLMVTS